MKSVLLLTAAFAVMATSVCYSDDTSNVPLPPLPPAHLKVRMVSIEQPSTNDVAANEQPVVAGPVEVRESETQSSRSVLKIRPKAEAKLPPAAPNTQQTAAAPPARMPETRDLPATAASEPCNCRPLALRRTENRTESKPCKACQQTAPPAADETSDDDSDSCRKPCFPILRKLVAAPIFVVVKSAEDSKGARLDAAERRLDREECELKCKQGQLKAEQDAADEKCQTLYSSALESRFNHRVEAISEKRRALDARKAEHEQREEHLDLIRDKLDWRLDK